MMVQKVLDISSMAFLDAIDIQFIIETLEAGNMPSSVAAVNAACTDKVAQCIYRSLWTRLVVIVARAYAEARPGDLHAQYAFDLLKEPSTRSDVEKRGDITALADAIERWKKCRGDHRLKLVREFRDKQIAHWGELDATRRPIINDIFAVSRATAATFERLAQGTGAVTLSLDSQLIGYRKQAERFWTNQAPTS